MTDGASSSTLEVSTDQVESTVQQLGELHEAHLRQATYAQRIANRITGSLGKPAALLVVILVIMIWTVGNFMAHRAGVTTLEEPPFPELGLLLTIVALLVALLILTTQRHEQALAEKRAQLTLQIAILSEKKIAKLIEMIDGLRLSMPSASSRPDPEAQEMSHSADPIASMERIETERRD